MKRHLLTKAFWNPNSPPPPPAPPEAKTFTQEDVDRIVQDRLKKQKDEAAKLVSDLEAMREAKNLTEQQKAAIEERIKATQEQHMTEAQRMASDYEKAQKKLKEQLDSVSGKSSEWETSFKSLLVKNTIMEAADKHKALSPMQMHMLLAGQAKVTQSVNEAGEPIGWSVKLPTAVVDPKTKQPVILDLDLDEAVGKMREDKQFMNLFKFEGQGGFGLGGTLPGGAGDAKGINWKALSPEDYAKNRDKILG